MDKIEDYWERGPGSKVPPTGPCLPQPGRLRLGPARRLVLDAGRLQARIAAIRRDNVIDQIVENDNDRAGLVVSASEAGGRQDGPHTVLEAAASLGEERQRSARDRDLVVMLRRQQRPQRWSTWTSAGARPTTTGPDRRRTARRGGLVHRVPALARLRASGPSWSRRSAPSGPAT